MYTQSFPAKFLAGNYEFEANLFGTIIPNKGKFTLDLCTYYLIFIFYIIKLINYQFNRICFSFFIRAFIDDLTQTTTATRKPGEKIKVRVNVETIGNLKLHISNLLHGRAFLENILDKIINGTWQPGFIITRGIINDLVSTAFTEIFGKAFQKFPFEKIIDNKSINS